MLNERWSASKSALLYSPCTAWLHPAAEWDEASSEAADHGTEVHKAIEIALNGSPTDPIGGFEEYTGPAVKWLEGILGASPYSLSGLTVEPSISVQQNGLGHILSTGRESYPKEPGYLNGTADVVYIPFDKKTCIVVDWKTGDPYKAKDQLMTIAALLSAVCPSIQRYALYSAKVEPGRTLTGLSLSCTGDEAKAILADLKARMAAAPGKHVIGEHCYELYCPHRFSCKAMSDVYGVEGLEVPSDQNIHKLIPAYKLLNQRAARMKESVENFVREKGGIQMPDGKVFQETTVARTNLNKSKLEALAQSLGATDQEVNACYTTSIGSGGFRSVKPK